MMPKVKYPTDTTRRTWTYASGRGSRNHLRVLRSLRAAGPEGVSVRAMSRELDMIPQKVVWHLRHFKAVVVKPKTKRHANTWRLPDET